MGRKLGETLPGLLKRSTPHHTTPHHCKLFISVSSLSERRCIQTGEEGNVTGGRGGESVRARAGTVNCALYARVSSIRALYGSGACKRPADSPYLVYKDN
ncbi:hypothetical protein PDJAM_G00063290 [Pangasius djambal]|uniref:Uncharacterized protein n=1 Tax=Pangasius djambal TaxID=1691987 RepID=A0ACC5YYU7_9TELE|nr:hypothetical protein [Pangasius djambal]